MSRCWIKRCVCKQFDTRQGYDQMLLRDERGQCISVDTSAEPELAEIAKWLTP